MRRGIEFGFGLVVAGTIAGAPVIAADIPQRPPSIRIATFNASLNRERPGELTANLATPDDLQARNVAEIIQRVRPDVLLLNEFDYDAAGRSVTAFQANYLARSQNGAEPIAFAHSFSAEVNTGVASGVDLDGDGRSDHPVGDRAYGNDALGYGAFPGQYGMVVLSRHPIDRDRVRRFGGVLWRELPGALLPQRPDGSAYYPPAALDRLRLSSKNHWDVPIAAPGGELHLLASHPTPPTFDGPEDRNGRRNHDEIRLWADYLAGGPRSGYLGSPEPPSRFVIVGDLNADPVDGESVPGAIDQLLKHPKVNAGVIPVSVGGAGASRLQGGTNLAQRGEPARDTADFDDRSAGNLRADYVLPSRDFAVVGSGVFWPEPGDPLSRLVRMTPTVASSDHRLVYLDLVPTP